MKNRFLAIAPSLIICFLLVSCEKEIPGKVTFEVNVPPPYHTKENKLFIAGNFNNWSPNNAAHELKYKSDGIFELTIEDLPEIIEYKYTRGDWESVEKDQQGSDIENRKFNTYTSNSTEDKITAWKAVPRKSTASENVLILDSAFQIPQLNRTRQIWVYLPLNYEGSDQKYPVIYMHDAQNLFNYKTSFVGEWEIDETLNSLTEEGKTVPIVVGIDNGGKHRMDEYSPYTNPQYGGGEGDAYLEFIVNTLKPHIDTTFRVLNDSKNTAIAGSSMGGLISFYAGVKYPETFGKVFVFSPSFWYSDKLFDLVETTTWSTQPKMYFLVGENEGGDMVDDMEDMIDLLKEKGYLQENLTSLIVPEGEHNEKLWSRQWEKAYRWMFHE